MYSSPPTGDVTILILPNGVRDRMRCYGLHAIADDLKCDNDD